MKKQYAVLGLGRFGSKIAKELFYKGQEVIAIDKEKNILMIKGATPGRVGTLLAIRN